MSKYLFVAILLLSALKGVDTLRGGLSVVTIENDVITGNALPRYGTLCEQAEVRSAPYSYGVVLYTLPKGEEVRLREQSHGDDRSWVMIKPARWIKLSALCTR